MEERENQTVLSMSLKQLSLVSPYKLYGVGEGNRSQSVSVIFLDIPKEVWRRANAHIKALLAVKNMKEDGGGATGRTRAAGLL